MCIRVRVCVEKFQIHFLELEGVDRSQLGFYLSYFFIEEFLFLRKWWILNGKL